MYGTVKFNSGKGYLFITSNGVDYFAHHDGSEYDISLLQKDDPVTFDPQGPTPKGWRAENVRPASAREGK